MYTNVPKDMTKIKTRLLGGLSKRQLICFSIGGLIGLPAFFLTRNILGNSGAMLLMMALAAPAFILAMYERDGQPAEKILRNMLRACWFFPATRPYKTENLYAQIQDEIKKEALVDPQPKISKAGTAATTAVSAKRKDNRQKQKRA